MEGKYAVSDDFFSPFFFSFIKAENAALSQYSNQSHKWGLIYSIQSLLS